MKKVTLNLIRAQAIDNVYSKVEELIDNSWDIEYNNQRIKGYTEKLEEMSKNGDNNESDINFYNKEIERMTTENAQIKEVVEKVLEFIETL